MCYKQFNLSSNIEWNYALLERKQKKEAHFMEFWRCKWTSISGTFLNNKDNDESWIQFYPDIESSIVNVEIELDCKTWRILLIS